MLDFAVKETAETREARNLSLKKLKKAVTPSLDYTGLEFVSSSYLPTLLKILIDCY